MAERWLSVETRVADPIDVGRSKVFPMAQSIRLRLPGLPASVSWSRPVSVAVSGLQGEPVVLPIVDVTRRAQLGLLGLGALGALLFWLTFRRR